MTIKEKLQMDRNGLMIHGPITIVAFGDSVTHGALRSQNDYESVYHHRLAKKLSAVRDYVPVNVINAGIGGLTARGSLERMERQVFSHHPDLVIVAFGLNDVNGSLEHYLEALETIFRRSVESGAETVFLTPNMLNTYVAEDTPTEYIEYAHKTADYQNSGRMDEYMAAACELARSMGVKVADCYARWKKRSETEDTTMLLINRINHPTAEMHELFADTIFQLIMGEDEVSPCQVESTMYR
ncbi:MAG: GDSL family lipase [Clostridia bacterium]|nr:GDSL family lipase [Clostridia bacterium]